jgi:hypothetical protein
MTVMIPPISQDLGRRLEHIESIEKCLAHRNAQCAENCMAGNPFILPRDSLFSLCFLYSST